MTIFCVFTLSPLIKRNTYTPGVIPVVETQCIASLQTRMRPVTSKSPDSYTSIVSALSKVRSGLTRNELRKNLGKDSSGSLSKKLEDLVNCDIIRKLVVRKKKCQKKFSHFSIDGFLLDFLSDICPEGGNRGE